MGGGGITIHSYENRFQSTSSTSGIRTMILKINAEQDFADTLPTINIANRPYYSELEHQRNYG